MTAKVYKPCLYFFISFYLSLTSVKSSSLSKSLFHPSSTSLHSQSVHAMYKTFFHKTWIASQSYFIELRRYMWYHSITEMGRRQQRFTSLVCLSSLVSLSFMSVTFPSSSKPLFPRFIDPSTLTCTIRTCDIWNIHKTWIARQSYFTIITVHTRNIPNHDRLEWLLNRILSFSQSIHATYETMMDYHQCGARSSSAQ